METYLPEGFAPHGALTCADKVSIQKEIVRHVEYTLARTRLNFESIHAYQATAHRSSLPPLPLDPVSLRDRLVERFNDTMEHFDEVKTKEVVYISVEFLMGRSLRNAVYNLGLVNEYTQVPPPPPPSSHTQLTPSQALDELGFSLEELYDQEKDAALGNGGLGRLAACFMDSMATLNLPGWGYGLRYSYGMFEQKILFGEQIELPDSW
jgi:glycogen phosphorylase